MNSSSKKQQQTRQKYKYNSEDFDVRDAVDNPKTNEPVMHKFTLKCKNEHQKEFVKLIEDNQITICTGDSGVGKSYLSLAKALEMYKDRANGYNKIFLITPIVEVEESIGYLKGSIEDKIAPYLYSIYYIIDGIVGETTRKKMVELEIIKPLCISYLRGVNLDNCLTVCDEAQNLSVKGMKTLLTRIGHNTKFIISGDVNQIDKFRDIDQSGLVYAYNHLGGINGIGLFEFEKKDIVRNPIITDILDRFN